MARTTRKNGSDVSSLMNDGRQSGSTGRSSRPSGQQSRRQSVSVQITLTDDQIAERAKSIWQAKGCKVGQDLENWFEAEQQLKSEMQASC
ncbi:MAG: DUF2934 domain-containing protein [Planctomycetaceae bacterium]|nr:DUF2934 domain-containing protein [Planctomycetaceae bacterium]